MLTGLQQTHIIQLLLRLKVRQCALSELLREEGYKFLYELRKLERDSPLAEDNEAAIRFLIGLSADDLREKIEAEKNPYFLSLLYVCLIAKLPTLDAQYEAETVWGQSLLDLEGEKTEIDVLLILSLWTDAALLGRKAGLDNPEAYNRLMEHWGFFSAFLKLTGKLKWDYSGMYLKALQDPSDSLFNVCNTCLALDREIGNADLIARAIGLTLIIMYEHPAVYSDRGCATALLINHRESAERKPLLEQALNRIYRTVLENEDVRDISNNWHRFFIRNSSASQWIPCIDSESSKPHRWRLLLLEFDTLKQKRRLLSSRFLKFTREMTDFLFKHNARDVRNEALPTFLEKFYDFQANPQTLAISIIFLYWICSRGITPDFLNPRYIAYTYLHLLNRCMIPLEERLVLRRTLYLYFLQIGLGVKKAGFANAVILEFGFALKQLLIILGKPDEFVVSDILSLRKNIEIFFTEILKLTQGKPFVFPALHSESDAKMALQNALAIAEKASHARLMPVEPEVPEAPASVPGLTV